MMSENEIVQQIAQLLSETHEAHHKAFAETDGFDPDWPLWYADYLHAPLSQALKGQFTKSELVYLLLLAEHERNQQAPGAEWTGFYARLFVERYL